MQDLTLENGSACGACGEWVIENSSHLCMVEVEYNAELNQFSFGDIVKLLAKDGIKSEVMHTGGGCATLFCGEPNAEGYYPVVCGAGVYEPENPANSIGFYGDFWIGTDDDKQTGFQYKGKSSIIDLTNVIFDYFMFDKVAN